MKFDLGVRGASSASSSRKSLVAEGGTPLSIDEFPCKKIGHALPDLNAFLEFVEKEKAIPIDFWSQDRRTLNLKCFAGDDRFALVSWYVWGGEGGTVSLDFLGDAHLLFTREKSAYHKEFLLIIPIGHPEIRVRTTGKYVKHYGYACNVVSSSAVFFSPVNDDADSFSMRAGTTAPLTRGTFTGTPEERQQKCAENIERILSELDPAKEVVLEGVGSYWQAFMLFEAIRKKGNPISILVHGERISIKK